MISKRSSLKRLVTEVPNKAAEEAATFEQRANASEEAGARGLVGEPMSPACPRQGPAPPKERVGGDFEPSSPDPRAEAGATDRPSGAPGWSEGLRARIQFQARKGAESFGTEGANEWRSRRDRSGIKCVSSLRSSRETVSPWHTTRLERSSRRDRSGLSCVSSLRSSGETVSPWHTARLERSLRNRLARGRPVGRAARRTPLSKKAASWATQRWTQRHPGCPPFPQTPRSMVRPRASVANLDAGLGE